MTQTLDRPATRESIPLSGPRLPRSAPYLALGASVVAGVALALILGRGIVVMALFAGVLYIAAITVWAASLEGRRGATDRFVTSVVWAVFLVALVPLASLVYTVVSLGAPAVSAEFLTFSMRGVVGDAQGGIYHALVGSVLITAGAAVISIPIGVMSAIYLVEYGKRNRLARSITFLVDVMTGIPSIVAGLFAYALFVLVFGPGVRMGIGGSVALSLLMIPIVVRSTEEMLKLVPDELREAAYALGVPKWRTIVKVVLPTALSGILTGVTLSIARVIGETAPLLIIAGSTTSVNFNLFADRMQTLPVFIYYQLTQPGVPPEFGIQRAWGAALVLIVIVMALNLLARVIGKVFAPKTGR